MLYHIIVNTISQTSIFLNKKKSLSIHYYINSNEPPFRMIWRRLFFVHALAFLYHGSFVNVFLNIKISFCSKRNLLYIVTHSFLSSPLQGIVKIVNVPCTSYL